MRFRSPTDVPAPPDVRAVVSATPPFFSIAGGQSWRTDVHVGAGILGESAFWDYLLPEGRRLVVVSDRNVWSALGARLRQGLGARSFVESIVEPGEASKCRAVRDVLEDQWFAAGLGRDSLCLAFGGGVVGDLAGFVAATYLRGIPVLQVPTSLVAMVDSSIGGKTGIDVPAGKNLVGAFHPPLAVVADVEALRTLPDDELRFGLAEVVKHAIIADADLFSELESVVDTLFARDPNALAAMVEANLRIKGRVVEADEREGGLRQILNLGHTIGHALERLANYALPHGAAVALGTLVELKLAQRLRGFPAAEWHRVEALLARIGLPTRLGTAIPWSASEILAAGLTDKKARAGKVRYALPNALGRFEPVPAWGYAMPVADDLAVEAIESLRT